MAKAEIDSFILKFKNLLLSGRNATLVLKSNAGNADVSLNVDLGQVPPQPTQHVHHQSRDGPSRQRRRLRRAQARATEAEEVSDAQVETAAQAKDSETVSGQRLEWTKVRTGENVNLGIYFNEIKINVSILYGVLNNKTFNVVHWPKPTDF